MTLWCRTRFLSLRWSDKIIVFCETASQRIWVIMLHNNRLVLPGCLLLDCGKYLKDISWQNQMPNAGMSYLSTSVKTSLEFYCENWVHWIWSISLLKSFFQRNDERKQHKICIGCLWVFLGIARMWSCVNGIKPEMAVSYSYISSF